MSFNLRVRIPGWARNEPVPGNLYRFINTSPAQIKIKLNGRDVNYSMEKGYAVLNRKWQKGDKVEIILPMDMEKIMANENVKEDKGRFALQRGPLVYCLEGPDQKDSSVHSLVVKQGCRCERAVRYATIGRCLHHERCSHFAAETIEQLMRCLQLPLKPKRYPIMHGTTGAQRKWPYGSLMKHLRQEREELQPLHPKAKQVLP
jgi:hypothetical protein